VSNKEKKDNTKKEGEGILGQISDQAISSMMEENRVFPPPKEFSRNAAVKSMDEYKAMYQESIKDPDKFWGNWNGSRSGINTKSMTSKINPK
jgi:hypothetical protein